LIADVCMQRRCAHAFEASMNSIHVSPDNVHSTKTGGNKTFPEKMAPAASGPSPGALDWPMSTDPEVAAKLQLRASWSHIIPKLDDRVQLANKLRAAVLATEGAHDEVIADMVLRHVCCLPLLAHRFKSSASTQGAHRACAQLTWPCCSVAV
jgi:hypothetical protein